MHKNVLVLQKIYFWKSCFLFIIITDMNIFLIQTYGLFNHKNLFIMFVNFEYK